MYFRGSWQDHEDRGRIARIAVGSSNGFQLNDGNTLLNTVLVSDKSQIFNFFRHVENHCLSPGGVYSDTLSGGKGSHRETITKPGRIWKPLQPVKILLQVHLPSRSNHKAKQMI